MAWSSRRSRRGSIWSATCSLKPISRSSSQTISRPRPRRCSTRRRSGSSFSRLVMGETRTRSEIAGPLAVLTLDRQDKLNALDGAMIAEIEAWVDAVERDRAVRVAILTGAGAKVFSAGGDIDAWAGLDPIDFARRWIREG